MLEIDPVHISGDRAFGFTSWVMDDGHGGKLTVHGFDLGNEIGRRDPDSGLFRLDPIKTGGRRFGRPAGLGDRLEAW